MKSQIDAKTRTIQSNTQKLSILSAQRKQLASQAETLAQIKLKRSQLQNLLGNYSAGLETLRKELDELRLHDASVFPRALPSFDRLKDVFGADGSATAEYQWEKLDASLKRKMVELKASTQQKSDQVTSSAAHASSLQSQLRNLDAQIQTAKKQLSANRAEFVSADLEALFSGTHAELEEEIAKANKLLEKATNEQMLGSSAKLMYRRFVGIARESHKCYLCNRDFASKAEEENFIATNTDKMEKLHTAEKAERAKAATKAAKARLEQVQALMPIYIASQQLQSTDIPKLESQLLQIQSDIAVAAASKSTVEAELKELKEREETYVDLLRNSGSISRLFSELQTMHSSLRSSEQKLEADARAASEAAGGGKAANLELVTNEYEAIEKLNVTLQRECNALQEKLESARSEKQKLIERVNRLKDESMQLAKIGDDKERLKQQETENLKAYNDLKGETQALVSLPGGLLPRTFRRDSVLSFLFVMLCSLSLQNDQLPTLKHRITEQLSRREEDRSRSSQVESQHMNDAAKMQRELDQFRTLVTDVERYEKQLQDRVEMKKDLQAKKALLDSQRVDRARLQKELAMDQESAGKNEKIDGDIKANLEYRERERAIVQHQKKIDERTAQLRAVSGGELLEDLRQLNQRLVRSKEKRSELRGSMNSEARMCEDIIATLTSERYRNIDDRYKTKLIDVKTHQLANADLETYHRALDRALMHYHSLKMKEINEVSTKRSMNGPFGAPSSADPLCCCCFSRLSATTGVRYIRVRISTRYSSYQVSSPKKQAAMSAWFFY